MKTALVIAIVAALCRQMPKDKPVVYGCTWIEQIRPGEDHSTAWKQNCKTDGAKRRGLRGV